MLTRKQLFKEQIEANIKKFQGDPKERIEFVIKTLRTTGQVNLADVLEIAYKELIK